MSGVVLLIVCEGDCFLGFVLVCVVIDEVELMLFVVILEVCGVGIGWKLLWEIMCFVGLCGVMVYFFEVRNDNLVVKLYGDEGLLCVGYRIGYYWGSDGKCCDVMMFC